jgi:type II secretory pathway component GspD/PulD (secretin)
MRSANIAVLALLLLLTLAPARGADLGAIKVGFISVEKIALEDFFRLLSEKYGQNFVVEGESIRKLPVSIRLRDVTLETLLGALCRSYNLGYRDRGDHIVVSELQSYYEDELFIKNDRNFVSKRLKFAPINSVIELLANLMPGKVVINEAKEHKLYQNLFDASPDLSEPAELSQTEVTLLPEESGGTQTQGGSAQRGGAGAQEQNGAAMVRLNPSYLYVASYSKTNTIYLSSADSELLEKALSLIETLDEPTKEVLLQGRIIEVSLNDEFKSFFDFVVRDHSLEAASEMPASIVSVGNIQYSFLDSLISANIEVLKKDGKAKTLASPMLLAADRTMAKLELNQDYSVLKGWKESQVITNENSTIVIPPAPVYTTESLGTSLRITPFINEDGEVLLNLNINISTLLPKSQEMLVLSGTDKYVVQTFDAINKNDITATLVTKDRQGIVLGGIFREEEADEEQKVPLLGDIPLLGIPFRKTVKKNIRRELIIILTPYIVGRTHSDALLGELRQSTGMDKPMKQGEYEMLKKELGIKPRKEMQP